MALSVLLVDDHPVVRRGLRTLLEANAAFIVCGEACDGLEAVRHVERFQPDLVVLDIMMPGLNGLDALRIFRQRSPQTRVVVLSMYSTAAFVVEAMRCGASGYVLKGATADEIVAALRAATAGQSYLSPELSSQSLETYRAQTDADGQDRHELLTPRERQVFQLAAEGRTCAEIGLQLHISERTAERHRANFLHKLGLRTQTELVLYAVRRGILVSDAVQASLRNR